MGSRTANRFGLLTIEHRASTVRRRASISTCSIRSVDRFLPVDAECSDHEAVTGLRVARDRDGVFALVKRGTGDPVDPVLPSLCGREVESRERFAVDVDLVAVLVDVERLDADVGVDRRLDGYLEGVFGRAVADEIRSWEVEFASVLAEVFFDIDEHVVRAGSLGHRRSSKWTGNCPSRRLRAIHLAPGCPVVPHVLHEGQLRDTESVGDALHFLRDPLDAERLGVSVLDCEPDWTGKEHDQADGQEEVYVLVRDEATITVEGDDVDVRAGDAHPCRARGYPTASERRYREPVRHRRRALSIRLVANTAVSQIVRVTGFRCC